MNPPHNEGRHDRGDWDEYRRLVVDTLERLDESLQRLHREVGSLQTEIARLQVKAGFWGALSGLVAGVGIALLAKFKP